MVLLMVLPQKSGKSQSSPNHPSTLTKISYIGGVFLSNLSQLFSG